MPKLYRNFFITFSVVIILYLGIDYAFRTYYPGKNIFSNLTEEIIEHRPKDTNILEVILNEGVTDEEAKTVAKELMNLEGVTGSNIYSKQQQKTGDYSFLYPISEVSFEPGSRVVIDLYIEDINYKNPVIEVLRNHPKVDKAIDLIIM